VSTGPTAASLGLGPASRSGPYGQLAAPGTRVLLIGTAEHSGRSGLPNLLSVGPTIAKLRRVLIERCGVSPGNIGEPLVNPATQAEIGHALVARAEAATDVLLVYYCGHGLIGTDGQLYLATGETVARDPGLSFTSLPYQRLRESMAGCRAQAVVVIADCCFAGRATEPAPGALAALAAPGAAAGGYLLASAAYSEAALAPKGEPYTAFSGALIGLLTTGIADGPRLITLTGLYRELDRTLSAQGRPRPVNRSSGSAGDLVVAVNARYRPPRFGDAPLAAAPADDSGAPYRGLAAYDTADAGLFFGRATLVEKLRGALAGQLALPGPLVVLGPSGSGKSSLLRAGLRPSLDNGLPGARHTRTWPKIVLTPGGDPLGSLAAQLGGLLAADPAALRTSLGQPGGLAGLAREAAGKHAGDEDPVGQRLIVIADQFEEIFGPEVDRSARDAFIATLDGATARPDGGDPPPVLAVVGLRADFYGRALSEPFLAAALTGKRTVDVTPMSRDELREVITRPAAAAGLSVEPELVDRILADLQAEQEETPGGHDTQLPLLSLALLTTWRYRQGTTLTLRGYQAAGGVSGAVAHSARELWAGGEVPDGRPQRALTGEERNIARRLLLQLVYVGPEGTGPVRRRARLAELAATFAAGPDGRDQVELASRVLSKLVAARLVTVDREHVEIVHDALLHTWPELRGWIDADRVNLAIGQQVAEAAAEWDRLGRHRGDLYRGSRLGVARQWRSAARQVPALAAEFLQRSERAARGRRRGVAAGVTALVTALAVIAALLVVSVSDAGRLRAQNSTLESQQVAAGANAVRGTDPELARDLALSAYHLAPTDQAEQSLAESSVTPSAAEINVGGAGTPNLLNTAFSPDGSLLAASNGKTGAVTVWENAESGRPVLASTTRFPHHCVLAFMPGTRVLAASCDGVTTLLDVARPRHPARTVAFGTADQPTETVAISPDGRWLATGGYDGLIQLWDISNRSRPRLADSADLHVVQTSSIAFSADSKVLALDVGNKALVTALTSRTPLTHLITVPGSQRTFAVTFRPHIPELAVANPNGPPLLYSTADLGHIKTLPAPSWDTGQPQASVSFTPDGRTLALGLANGGVELGPAQAGSQQAQAYTLPSPGITEATAFSPDGRYLADADSDGIVRVWDVARQPTGSLGSINSNFVDQNSVSPDGKLLVFPGSSGGLEVWDVSNPARPVRDAVLPPAWTSASFTPSGRILMTMDMYGTEVQLWDLANPRAPAPLTAAHFAGAHLLLDASPFGPLLAIADSVSNSVTVWDIRNPGNPVKRATITHGQLSSAGIPVSQPIFLSGTVLGMADSQNTALLGWDLSRPGAASPLVPLPTPGGFTGIADASSSRCHTLATASSGHQVQLWEMANPRAPTKAMRVDIASTLLAYEEPLVVTNACLLAEATNAGTSDDIKVWDVRNPRSPRLITTLATTGTIQDIEVSDDSSRIDALVQPPANSAASTQTLDVWSVNRSGVSPQFAALQVSSSMNRAEFIPNSHLILFSPATVNEVLPDILNADPSNIYSSLCATTQPVLSRSSWSRYVPGIPYEPPC
jgi:WD40 repeat protein